MNKTCENQNEITEPLEMKNQEPKGKSTSLGFLAGSEAVRDIICGSLAGICGKLVEHPVDTVKIRLQTQATLLSHQVPQHQQPFSGAWNCFRKTWQMEGIVGLYRGLPSPLVGATLENATLFMGYNLSQSLIRAMYSMDSHETLSGSQLLVAGAMASAAAAVVLTPVELVKCRAQVASVQQGLYTKPNAPIPKISAWKVLMQVLTKDGPLTLYRGFSWTAVREIGGGTTWFGMYELMCKLQMQRDNVVEKSQLKPWQLMLSGAMAGVAYNASFYPADVLKSISQTQKEKMSLKQLIEMVWKQGGIKAFYKGFTITVARAIPSNAIVFFMYETLSSRWRDALRNN